MTRSLLVNADRQPVDLVSNHTGSTAVLLCRGASFREHDRLASLGYPIFAVNGYDPTKVKPTYWLCMDPTKHFAPEVLTDPGTFKFIPFTHRGDYLNALYYRLDCRGGYPDEFFESHWVDVGHDPTVPTGVRSVMLPAFRFLYELGFEDVLLVGCDFPVSGYEHDPLYYDKLQDVLNHLAPEMAKRGLRVWNCNPSSNLETFPRMALDEALEHVAPPAATGVARMPSRCTDAAPVAFSTYGVMTWT